MKDSEPKRKKNPKYTYTVFYNRIYDAFMAQKPNGSEWAVFMYTYRETVGYQGRTIDFKSVNVAHMTGHDPRTVDKAYKALHDANIIESKRTKNRRPSQLQHE